MVFRPITAEVFVNVIQQVVGADRMLCSLSPIVFAVFLAAFGQHPADAHERSGRDQV